MKFGKIAAMMGAVLASGAASNQGAHETHLFKKQNTPLVPYNPSVQWHPQAGKVSGAAKQRRAATKTRNINRQKKHPNTRSAKC
jgi:hypothetical protein